MRGLGNSRKLGRITTSDMDGYIERVELKGYSPNIIDIVLVHFAHS